MFNNSLEKNRYSLRKLSVGLASVLIGISFIEANGQTAKADTVDGGNTAAISTNVEKTTSGAGNATSDANGSLGAAGSTNAGQESVKENGSQNYNANDSAQAITAKTEAVKGTIIAAKAALDAANDTKTNSTIDINQANTDVKDVVNEAQTGNAKQQNGNNNAQAAKNTNVEVTKDVQVADKETQTLDVNKNSRVLDSEALAINLTQDNLTQDISKITDPSKIDASHFADGTHWTPAGWTRTDKNTKIAKQSSITLPDSSGYTIDATKLNPTYVTDLNFTLDKNDMKAGNRILVATIQQVPTNAKQDVSNYEKQPRLSTDRLDSLNLAETYQNQEIGTLTATNLDNGEIDFYFNVTKDMPDLINDPSFTNKLDGDFFTTNRWRSWTGFYSYKNNLQYPLHYSIISNSKILNYSIVPPTVSRVDPNQQKTNSVFLDCNWNHIQYTYSDIQHQLKNDPTLEGGFVYKITTLKGAKPMFSHISYSVNAQLLDANGNPIYSGVQIDGAGIPATHKADNLSALDLWNNTSSAQFSYSNQKDGSVIVCFKPSAKANSNPAINKANAKNSCYANVVDPQHYQQIVDNAGKITAPSGWTAWFPINDSSYVDTAYQVTDLTPSGVNVSNSGTMLLQTASTGSLTSSDIETLKNVKISYIDDDATDQTKSNISSDSMTGRQNKVSTYTVNIPKGYYLDDNNISTGYTWNADHTAITYTFNEDQAKNDANPIVIHLKHIHSAVKDDKYLKNTSVRIITFDFPAGHGDPETITQTIGWTRTGTYDEVTAAAKGLDEAEKEGNYTDWVFTSDPAATKVTVTVNGKDDPTLASKYQSYDGQAYAKDNSDVEFAAIPIPKIPGYKAQFVQDKANPAMFFVSFMALPDQNHDNNESKDDHDISSTDPVKPVNPSDDAKHDSDNTEVPVIPSDHKDTVDIPTEPEVSTVPVDTDAAKNIPASDDASDVITMDKPANAPVNAEMHVTDSTWYIKNEATTDTSYTVVNSEYELQLPRFNGYTLRLVKRNAARDAISFVYVNPNKTLKYVFNIKLTNGKYILTIGKVTEDGIIQLEKVTFSDYNQLITLIAKAVNR